jgi:hypothetical protein
MRKTRSHSEYWLGRSCGLVVRTDEWQRVFYITYEMQLIQCSLLLSALYMSRVVFFRPSSGAYKTECAALGTVMLSCCLPLVWMGWSADNNKEHCISCISFDIQNTHLAMRGSVNGKRMTTVLTERECVYCAVRTGYLYIIQILFTARYGLGIYI